MDLFPELAEEQMWKHFQNRSNRLADLFLVILYLAYGHMGLQDFPKMVLNALEYTRSEV